MKAGLRCRDLHTILRTLSDLNRYRFILITKTRRTRRNTKKYERDIATSEYQLIWHTGTYCTMNARFRTESFAGFASLRATS